MKFEENVQNCNENIRKYETKHCFAVSRNNSKHTFSYFFQFRETIEARRNSDLFRTVLYFAKLKKYETVNPVSIILQCLTPQSRSHFLLNKKNAKKYL